MGLLSRLSFGRGADRSGVESVASAEASAPAEPVVFRAATEADIPGWAKLPPLRPSLPMMTLIVPEFRPSLAALQHPKRFVETLGHSVSPSAPSGVVEAIAVLSPSPPVEPAGAAVPSASGEPHLSDEPLPLARPPAPVTEKDSQPAGILPWWRTLQAMDVEPTFVEEVAQPHASVTDARADESPLAEAAGQGVDTDESRSAELIGSGPLSPVVQPLVAPLVPAPRSPLVTAPTPPDMPLARLPSALMLEEPSSPRATAFGGARVEARDIELPSAADETLTPTPGPRSAGLVAEQAIISDAPEGSPTTSVGPLPAPQEAPVADLPLAAPRQAAPDVEQSAAGRAAGHWFLDAEEPPRDLDSTAAETPASPEASPTRPASPAPDGEVAAAPLVGTGSPLAAEPPGWPGSPLAGTTTGAGSSSPASDEPLPLAPLAGKTAAAAGVEAAPSTALSAADEPAPRPDPAAASPPPPPADTVAESPVAAPLLGSAPPITGEPAPAGPGSEVPDRPAGGAASASTPPGPLALTPPPGPRRIGLGEPMGSLPPTATSWDITTWSPAQRMRASRALIRNESAPSVPAGALVGPPLANQGPRVARGPSAGQQSDALAAGLPLRAAVLERIDSSATGSTPPELEPASLLQAPLVPMDPLLAPEAVAAASSRSAPTLEGTRVRTAVGQRYGVDLTDVPLDRSEQGASEARRIGARAFTSDRAIVIPQAAGSLETGTGEALFAHELTHVAQRTRYGPHLPAESTAAGQELEAEAASAELSLAPMTPPPGPSSAASQQLGRGFAGAEAVGRTADGGLPLAVTATGPDVESLTSAVMERVSALTTPAVAGQSTELITAPWSSSPGPAAAPSEGVVQRAPDLPAPVLSAPAAPAVAQQATSPFANRPSDQDLTNLSRWLYPLIKFRLKGELRDDRERAGLLTDHYRRW